MEGCESIDIRAVHGIQKTLGRVTFQRFDEKLAEGKKIATYSRLKLTERLELKRVTEKRGKTAWQYFSFIFYNQGSNLRMQLCTIMLSSNDKTT